MEINHNSSFIYGGHNRFRKKAQRIYRAIRQVTTISLIFGIIGIFGGIKYGYTNVYIGFCGYSIVNVTVLMILLCLKDDVISHIYRKLLDGWCV